MSVSEELLEVCKEILMWVKFANLSKVKEVLVTVLDNDQKILAYDLSDGNNNAREISNQIGVSHTTIIRWWVSWQKLGLVEAISVQGGGKRSKKIFDLGDFGIKIPEVL